MKRWMYNALIILFVIIFLVSGGILAKYYIDAAKNNQNYDKLSDIMNGAAITPRPSVTDDTMNTEPTEPAMVDVIDPETGETVTLLPEFAELYVMNNDIVGWIRIPGTDIDYPVMQKPEIRDYYLRKDFDRNYSRRGSIYAQETCDVLTPSDNVVLYGHRMNDRSMFAQLDKYMKEDFYKENPYIYFDTLNGLHTYQVVAVFLTTASVGQGFPYHSFINAKDADDFDRFISGCKRIALYDTGVTAEYGDKLITLSTCEFSQTNGRLAIVAKRIG